MYITSTPITGLAIKWLSREISVSSLRDMGWYRLRFIHMGQRIRPTHSQSNMDPAMVTGPASVFWRGIVILTR